MRCRSSVLASSLLLASVQRTAAQDCPAVHVFGARETLVPSGFGSAGLVVDLVLSSFAGATSEVIDYPAAGANPDEYAASVADGIVAVANQVTAFSQQCPDTQIVMVGYSQGSQIMDTAFCGGPDGTSFESDGIPVPSDVGTRVAALIWMGNPRHVDGLPYNVGTAIEGGFAARPSGFICNTYSNRIQSYCDSPDPFCSTGDDEERHQAYGTIYGQDALAFIIRRLADRGIQESTATDASVVAAALVQAEAEDEDLDQATVSLQTDLVLPLTTTVSSGSPVTLTVPTQTSFAPPTMMASSATSSRSSLRLESALLASTALLVFLSMS